MAKKRTKIAEVDIAKAVVQHLRDEGWTVYQEVESFYGVADIIAVLDKKIWVVEAKNSLSLALIAQAKRWLGSAHWVSLAIPMRRNVLQSDARRLGMGILEDLGIGTFTVMFDEGSTEGRVEEQYSKRPRMFRRPNVGILKLMREQLVPQQKDFAAAGSKAGAHWTPYKESCFRIRKYLQHHPGCTVREIVDELGILHYSNASSARHSLSAMARGGHIPGVVARYENGKLRLFKEEKP